MRDASDRTGEQTGGALSRIRRNWVAGLIVLGLAALIAGCQSLPPWADRFFSTPTPPSVETATPQPTATDVSLPEPTEIEPRAGVLTLWLPVEFDLERSGEAGEILKARLDQYSQQHDITIEVRVKAPSGAAGMLDALSAARAAALKSVPSIALLSRSDLESAALKGLLMPLDISPQTRDAWYPYANQLSQVQDQVYGYPAFGDAMSMIYRPAKVKDLTSWQKIEQDRVPVLFAAANVQPLFALGLYESSGGKLDDEEGRPVLQTEELTTVLQFLRDGGNTGVFPQKVLQLENHLMVWDAYLEGTQDAAIDWASLFLTNLPADSRITSLPKWQDQSFSYATGWAWVITDPFPQRLDQTHALLNWLSEPQFLARWSEAAGFLPAQPEALHAWRNVSLQAELEPICLNSRLRPSNEQITALGPLVKDAQMQVIRQEITPENAARNAIQRLTNPSVP